jgi:hypothetical protein
MSQIKFGEIPFKELKYVHGADGVRPMVFSGSDDEHKPFKSYYAYADQNVSTFYSEFYDGVKVFAVVNQSAKTLFAMANYPIKENEYGVIYLDREGVPTHLTLAEALRLVRGE